MKENTFLKEDSTTLLEASTAQLGENSGDTQKYLVLAGKIYVTTEREGKIHICNT